MERKQTALDKRLDKAICSFAQYNYKQKLLDKYKGYIVQKPFIYITNGVYFMQTTRTPVIPDCFKTNGLFDADRFYQSKINVKYSSVDWIPVDKTLDRIKELKSLKKAKSENWTQYIKLNNDLYNYEILDRILKCFNLDSVLIGQVSGNEHYNLPEKMLKISDFETLS